MSRRIATLLGIVAALLLLLAGETLLFDAKDRTTDHNALRGLVALTALPDLSVATEAGFIRFRSLSDIASAFGESPELPDHFRASFVYAPAPLSYTVPSRLLLKASPDGATE